MSDNERLSRELRNRADTLGGHPISLDDVKRSATKMKRQRTAAAGAVAAVALAVAIPVGFSVAGNGSGGTTPIAVDPTITETPTGPIVTKEVTLTAEGAPQGGEPGVVYVHDKQIVEPDGSATDVDYNYSQLASFGGDGWIGIRVDDEGNPTADVLEADGTVARSFKTGYTLAVSSAGDVAAFEDVAGGGRIVRYDEAGEPTQTWEFADNVLIELEGILDDGSVVYATEGTDPALMVARASGDTQPVLGATNSGGVGASLISGMVSVDDLVPESCWNLFDASGAKQWAKARCDYTLGRFNESDHLMLGHPSYLDSIGDGLVSIIDVESGKALVEYDTPDDAFIANAVWEDESHVLALVHEPEGWFILRMDTEGNIENVSGAALPGDELSAPVQFGARP